MQYIEKTKCKNVTTHSGSTVDSTISVHKLMFVKKKSTNCLTV